MAKVTIVLILVFILVSSSGPKQYQHTHKLSIWLSDLKGIPTESLLVKGLECNRCSKSGEIILEYRR